MRDGYIIERFSYYRHHGHIEREDEILSRPRKLKGKRDRQKEKERQRNRKRERERGRQRAG